MESQSKPVTPNNYFATFADHRTHSTNLFKHVRRAENYRNNRLVNNFPEYENRDDDSVVMKNVSDEVTEDSNMNQNINNNGTKQNSNARETHYYNQEIRNRSVSHSSQNIVSKCVDMHHVTCSRKLQNRNSASYKPNDADLRDKFQSDNCSESTATENNCAEKTTYCRPVMHFYNQEYIYKSVERNARLQRLAKEMALARQIEKDKEAWNNYINNLKTKHRYYSNEPSRITAPYVPENFNDSDMVDDYYDTRFSWRQSNPCRNVLEDFYDCNTMPSSNYRRYPPGPVARFPRYGINERKYGYENDPYCFPTASQGRLLMMNRDREKEKERQRKEERESMVKENHWSRVKLNHRNMIIIEIEKQRKEEMQKEKCYSTQCSEPSNSFKGEGNIKNDSNNDYLTRHTTQYKISQTAQTSDTTIELKSIRKVSKNTSTPTIYEQSTNRLMENSQNKESQPLIKIKSEDNTYDNCSENIKLHTQTIPFVDNQSTQFSGPIPLCKSRCHNQNLCHCKTKGSSKTDQQTDLKFKQSSNDNQQDNAFQEESIKEKYQQTDLKFKQPSNDNQQDNAFQEESIKEKYEKVSEDVDRLKKTIQTIDDNKSIQSSELPPFLCKSRCLNNSRCHCTHKAIKGSFNRLTDSNIKLSGSVNEPQNESIKEKYEKVSQNVDRLKQEIQTNQYEKNKDSLTNIETKLDTLIESLNILMREIQSNNGKNCFCVAPVSCPLNSIGNRRLNFTKSDNFEMVKKEKNVCGLVQDNSLFSTMSKNRAETEKAKIDKILYEEMDKSNKVKRDIDEILNSQMDKSPAVKITYDIPTKDRSTEVTNSLSKTKLDSKVFVKEVCPSDTVEEDRNMTIAVNTDPVGLLALLKISSQTVKQILSYVPHIDYLSYLSMLQFPQMSASRVSHYICNICGAAFGRPSQLSDHIQQHNLGNSRDCCVCRHVLDMPGHRLGLFACQYCGQRFTRAYCCELHQKTCAIRLGKKHDVSSSLMLLT